MPAVQTTYSANIRPGLPGMIVDEVPKTLISRTVEAAGGLAFGIPVMQGTADKAGRAPTTGDTAAKFVGISVRDRSVKAEANQYSQYESARVMTEGAIWVTASVQVAAGDPVYFVPATGAWTNVATDNVQVAG
ncbi:structural cement protein Gp24, partial [Pseudomonas aeruginosa]